MKNANIFFCYYSIAVLLFMGCCSSVDQYEGAFGQENAVWTESIYLRGYQPYDVKS